MHLLQARHQKNFKTEWRKPRIAEPVDEMATIFSILVDIICYEFKCTGFNWRGFRQQQLDLNTILVLSYALVRGQSGTMAADDDFGKCNVGKKL